MELKVYNVINILFHCVSDSSEFMIFILGVKLYFKIVLKQMYKEPSGSLWLLRDVLNTLHINLFS